MAAVNEVPQEPKSYSRSFASNVKDPMLRHAIESGRLGMIAGVGAVGIVSILLLAIRTERRAVRAINFVAIADAVLNRDAVLVGRVGRLVAGGKYQLAFENTRAHGWFNITAPTRSLSGRATVDASRSHPLSSDWTITSLTASFDAGSLNAANQRRELIAEEAGYRPAGSSAAARTLEALPVEGVVTGADGVISFRVVPPPLR